MKLPCARNSCTTPSLLFPIHHFQASSAELLGLDLCCCKQVAVNVCNEQQCKNIIERMTLRFLC